MVAVVEDNSRAGGVGSAAGQALRDAGVDVPLRTYGLPERFLGRGEVPADIGLTSREIAGGIGAAPARIRAAEDRIAAKESGE
ncbi:hypothetical protein GCM10010518_07540 [Kitasatospora cinereorecta]